MVFQLFCPTWCLSYSSLSLENNKSGTHRNCSTTAVGAGNQAALRSCHGNLELLPIQMQWSSHAHWYGHVANHILTAGAHNLENRNVAKLVKQETVL